MSKITYPTVRFRHVDDCRQEGCPGHEMVAMFTRTTDHYMFLVDGKLEYVMDSNEWAAMLSSLYGGQVDMTSEVIPNTMWKVGYQNPR